MRLGYVLVDLCPRLRTLTPTVVSNLCNLSGSLRWFGLFTALNSKSSCSVSPLTEGGVRMTDSHWALTGITGMKYRVTALLLLLHASCFVTERKIKRT